MTKLEKELHRVLKRLWSQYNGEATPEWREAAMWAIAKVEK